MKILWITNIPFGKMRQLAGLDNKQAGGSWLDATLNEFMGVKDVSILVTTTWKTDSIKTLQEQNVIYCLLPGGEPYQYNHKSLHNRRTWEELKTFFKPDIINIWGTEFTHGYLALQVFHDTPAVIYMQGVLKSIGRYYTAGLSTRELYSNITLRDLIKLDWITRTKQKYLKRSAIEVSMINLAQNVIVENSWCATQCKAISPECTVYKHNLVIKKVFFDYNWSVSKMRPYTILCNAATYPIKGLHILLKSLQIVKKKYPDFKLYIPGQKSIFQNGWKENLKINGYTKLIKSLITEYNIVDNIIFLGFLDSDEMARHMERANVFVMPSSIENHSSMLLEALIVGIPCISSYVGGVPEYLEHNTNGLLYRFEEYELLALHIDSLFSDSQMAENLSINARKTMQGYRTYTSSNNNLLTIYEQILSK